MTKEKKKQYDLIIKLINKECHPNIIIENLDDLMDSFENQNKRIIKNFDRWYNLLATDGVNSKGIVRNDILRYKEELTTK